MIDLDHRVVQLCSEGTRAEFEGRLDDARAYYQQAWDAAQDDYAAVSYTHLDVYKRQESGLVS